LSCSQNKIILNDKIQLDCIQSNPEGIVPTDLYHYGNVEPTNEYPPFNKKLDVCGITLVAREDVSNLFMERVSKTIQEIFVINEFTDTTKQKELLTNLYKYNTVIPLFYGEDWYLNSDEESQWDLLLQHNSLCDIIMEGIDNPVMEVIEHILHHITDIGLHYSDYDNWGLTASSILYNVTQEAIAKEYYDISQYNDISDTGVRNRVILQEYAYWIIYTAWDLRKQYGPQESEWSIITGEELSTNLSNSYVLFQETIPSVMTCPDEETLNLFIESYVR